MSQPIYSQYGDFHQCDEDRLRSAACQVRKASQYDGCQVHCICKTEADSMKAFLQAKEPDVVDRFYFSWLVFPEHDKGAKT